MCPRYAVVAVFLSFMQLILLFIFYHVAALSLLLHDFYLQCNSYFYILPLLMLRFYVFCFRFICSWVIWFFRISWRSYFPLSLRLRWSTSNDLFFAGIKVVHQEPSCLDQKGPSFINHQRPSYAVKLGLIALDATCIFCICVWFKNEAF